MKTNRLLLTTIALLALSQTSQASSDGEALFKAKCSACHSVQQPSSMDGVVAPAIVGVMRHLKRDYRNRDEAIAFIKDYTINPTKDKAICKPEKLKKFGLMPSQKGSVTTEELEVIAAWMYDNFEARGSKKGKKASPFLINSLPHLSREVKKNWDNFDFDLSEKQQDSLIDVRIDTMSKIKAIKPKIKKLEENINRLVTNNEPLEKILPLVQEVAKLKIEATKVHIECLSNTKKILTDKQLEFLSSKCESK